MTSTPYYQYQPQATGSLPVNVPGKQPQQFYNARHVRGPSTYSALSSSPPERPESVSSSSGAGLYSSGPTSYAGSDYESSAGATNVELLDYMSERLSQAYDPLPLDRGLVKQAQTSGQLNAKNQELLALQAQARARLAKTRANFAEGMKTARDVQAELQWTQKKVSALNARAAQKYPEQYRIANRRYPVPSDE